VTAHRASRIEEIIAECGGLSLWLAPYSRIIRKMVEVEKLFAAESKNTGRNWIKPSKEGLKLITADSVKVGSGVAGYLIAQS